MPEPALPLFRLFPVHDRRVPLAGARPALAGVLIDGLGWSIGAVFAVLGLLLKPFAAVLLVPGIIDAAGGRPREALAFAATAAATFLLGLVLERVEAGMRRARPVGASRDDPALVDTVVEELLRQVTREGA